MSHPYALSVAIIGGGIGGLATAISLRRAGHTCIIYERANFVGEVGGAIATSANGSKWFKEWNVDVSVGRPVKLQGLRMRKWESGDEVQVVDLSGYEDQWGVPYYLFHRVDLHKMLLEAATGDGEGEPAQLLLDNPCTDIDFESNIVTFSNGKQVHYDLVIGADGVGSTVRRLLGITPDKTISTSACLHANVSAASVKKYNLRLYGSDDAQYWGGQGNNKIVRSCCRGGEIISYYCFFPRAASNFGDEGWMYKASVQELLTPYPDLDPDLRRHLEVSEDISPWRMWVHQPYPYWVKGRVALMGDAAHPMLPHQSQGACQAIEDAAALGIVFSKKYFSGNIKNALLLYENMRKGRATKVQEASVRARENLKERIGFSETMSNKACKQEKDENKLTTEDLNAYDMWADAEKRFKLI